MTHPSYSFQGLSELLPRLTAADVLRLAPELALVIPELAPMIGFDQRSPHHAYDLMTHVACVVENVGSDLPLRWAALLHDIGKVPTFTRDKTGRGHFYGHARESARMADAILRRLEAPDDLRETVVLLIDRHMLRLQPDKASLLPLLHQLGQANLNRLLILQEADMSSKGIPEEQNKEIFPAIRRCLAEIQNEHC